MGNKNNRGRPARQVASNTKSQATSDTKSIELPPQPPQCTDPHCEIRQRHDDTTYVVGQPNLPSLVEAKHTALDEALQAKKIFQARHARDWLMDFYTLHGLSTEIASNGLPDVPPPPPKRCLDSNCPVTQFHHEGIFNTWASDLPDMIMNGPIRLHNALVHGNYEHALSIHAFVKRFWMKHGPADGSALMEIPRPCTDAKCTVKAELHEDKMYGRWVRDKSLPNIVKRYEWEVTKVHDRWDPAWKEMKEMELLDGFFAVHGVDE